MAQVKGLVLLAYNAYYNHFLKQEESVRDYVDNSPGGGGTVIKNINFNPADGVNTEFILGKGDFDFDRFSPNYVLLIEYNSELTEDSAIIDDPDTIILNRWFILDENRTRGGQYKLSLKRDVLVDYLKYIKRSPIYVEKGILDEFGPFLCNNEGLNVNQIKTDEILLKDRTKNPWLVIYLKKGVLGDNKTISIYVPQNDDFVYKTLNTPITSWSYYQYISNDYAVSLYDTFKVNLFYVDQNNGYVFSVWDNDANTSFSYSNTTRGNLSASGRTVYDKLANEFVPNTSTMRTEALSAFSFNDTNPLLEYNDKIIKDSQGKYFKVRAYKSGQGSTTYDITSTNAPALKATMTNLWNTALEQTATPDNKAFQVKINYEFWRIELTELTDLQTTINLGDYTGEGTTDSALFDAICLPYGDVRIKGDGGTPAFNILASADRSMKAAASFCEQLTSEFVLDLQLLPYCPVQNFITADKTLTIPDSPNGCALQGIYNGDTTDLFLVCPNSNFTLDIEKSITIDDGTDYPINYKMKYLNDCTMLRICSPNYNGLFEMNLAKNGGQINRFNVDMTLRPFNPYIHVNPDFDFLYGKDYNDVRGLICNGDFSLGILNDAWNVYEIQNKNYQAIFDRQVQNLDVNNAIALQEALWGMGAGVGSAAASGATTGFLAGGGPWGALAGAVVGAGASAFGGSMDIKNLVKRQEETKSYLIDNFNLSLGNIRALPNSISKTSAITYNNKLFPFVEIYQCSYDEMNAFYNKIFYNGMTVGRIDYIEKFMSGRYAYYFRGKLIVFYETAVDNHIIEEINNELMRGVYI